MNPLTKNFKKLLLVILFFLLLIEGSYKNPVEARKSVVYFSNIEEALPFHYKNDKIIRHLAYTLKFDDKYKQADWVVYHLKKEYLAGIVKKKK